MWKKYISEHFDQDEAAQQAYAFSQSRRSPFYRSEFQHSSCGGYLETYYCEGGLYLVRCSGCSKVILIPARNPAEAATGALQ